MIAEVGFTRRACRFVRLPRLNWMALVYVEFIRGTPLLVVLFITYFALPALFGYHTTAYRALIFGFVLFIGAYLAEDFRSGLRAVRPSLIQAGLATGLTRWQVLRLIILPQAVRRTIPALLNQYVRLVKFTSVASVIGVTELTGAGLLVNARDFHPITILAAIAVTYLAICFFFHWPSCRLRAFRCEDLMNNDPIIVICDLHKNYGATPVLRGCNMEIQRGEVVVVCGPRQTQEKAR